jgi:hypothetical protein
MTRPTPHPGRPTVPSVATFVLSLATAVAVVTVAASLSPIDLVFIDRADDGLLLPHQELLTLAVYAAVALSLSLTVVSFGAMTESRRRPQPSRSAVDEFDAPRTWVA